MTDDAGASSRADLPRRPAVSLLADPQEDRRRCLAARVERSMANGSGDTVAAFRHVITRRPVWVSLSYSAFTDLDGERRLVAGTMRDVTARHLAAGETRPGQDRTPGRAVGRSARPHPGSREPPSSARPALGLAVTRRACRGRRTGRPAPRRPSNRPPSRGDAWPGLPHPGAASLQAWPSGRAFVTRSWMTSRSRCSSRGRIPMARSTDTVPSDAGQVLIVALVTSGRLLGTLSFAGPEHGDGFDRPTSVSPRSWPAARAPWSRVTAPRLASTSSTTPLRRGRRRHRLRGRGGAGHRPRSEALDAGGAAVFSVHPANRACSASSTTSGWGRHQGPPREVEPGGPPDHRAGPGGPRRGVVPLQVRLAGQEPWSPRGSEQVGTVEAVAVLPLRLAAAG